MWWGALSPPKEQMHGSNTNIQGCIYLRYRDRNHLRAASELEDLQAWGIICLNNNECSFCAGLYVVRAVQRKLLSPKSHWNQRDLKRDNGCCKIKTQWGGNKSWGSGEGRCWVVVGRETIGGLAHCFSAPIHLWKLLLYCTGRVATILGVCYNSLVWILNVSDVLLGFYGYLFFLDFCILCVYFMANLLCSVIFCMQLWVPTRGKSGV